MFDQNQHDLAPMNGATEQGLAELSSVAPETTAPVPTENEPHVNRTASRRHSEAGRKGAQRRHQLIQQGRRYEKEHGLKSGRQRLRQLLELGKLYEQEHGLGGSRRQPRDALERMDGDQLIKTLFRTLERLSKPAYRTRVVEALRKLEGDAQ
jgi:hypothetical protein